LLHALQPGQSDHVAHNSDTVITFKHELTTAVQNISEVRSQDLDPVVYCPYFCVNRDTNYSHRPNPSVAAYRPGIPQAPSTSIPAVTLTECVAGTR